MAKLALGTVQFGLDYGVSNRRGKISREEAFAILDEAAANGVTLLDTASAYGESEEVIGSYLRKSGRSFSVAGKFSHAGESSSVSVEEALDSSLSRLGQERLYAYLLHTFADLEKDPGLWDAFLVAKARGKTESIGFSLYYPQELETLYRNGIAFDVVQIPYSVFDRRFEPYLPELDRRGIEVHGRSVFLQGLVFVAPERAGKVGIKAGPYIERLKNTAQGAGVSVAELCLRFCLDNPFIDHVVIGVDGLDSFRSNCAVASEPLSLAASAMDLLKVEDEDVLVPSRWS